MKRVLVLLIFLALVACSPPATLVPVDTIVAQTMAAMPRTDTPVPTDVPTEGPPLTETPSPTVDFLVGVPGAGLWAGLILILAQSACRRVQSRRASW